MNTMDLTLGYYNEKADSFVSGIRDVDFSALQNEFVSYIKKGGRILDLGCGSGRVSKAFIEMGYEVVAVDGSQEIYRLASEYTGQQVMVCSLRTFMLSCSNVIILVMKGQNEHDRNKLYIIDFYKIHGSSRI